ncbi:hypothetical protein WR25_01906 [Diploscapter pachys]|uniref:Uncharacterized protein n=1 Tax=Diploscapter pachys TaxID=2018661 RepID=A0A2A2L4E0_9BILA|nr:hypothetical protein WR25_01906 [Diploscapter pachys]
MLQSYYALFFLLLKPGEMLQLDGDTSTDHFSDTSLFIATSRCAIGEVFLDCVCDSTCQKEVLYEDKPLEEKGFRKPAILLTGPRPGFAPLRLVSSNDTENMSASNENLAELSTTRRPKLHRLPRLRMAMRVKSKSGRRRARISAQSRVKPIAPPVAPPRADQAMPMPPAHQPGPPASRPDTSYGPPGIYPSKYYRLKRLQKQMKRAQRLKEKLEQRRKLQRIMEFRSK